MNQHLHVDVDALHGQLAALAELLPALGQRASAIPDDDDLPGHLSQCQRRDLSERRRKLVMIGADIASAPDLLTKPDARYRQLTTDHARLLAAREALTQERATAGEADAAQIERALRTLEGRITSIDGTSNLPARLAPLFVKRCGECGAVHDEWPGPLPFVEEELVRTVRRLHDVEAHVKSLASLATLLLREQEDSAMLAAQTSA